MKGFAVQVFASKSIGDCSNNGVTSKYNELYLVNDNICCIPRIVDVPEEQALVLKYRGKDYLCAVPLEINKSGKHSMFGGNFVYASDSRFPSNYPIPVHDRVERI